MDKRKKTKKNIIKKVAAMVLLSCTLLTTAVEVSNVQEIVTYGEKLQGEHLTD